MQNALLENGGQLMNKLSSWGELEAEGLSEQEIRKLRLDICNTCDALNKGRCGYCGCSISSETARPNAKCPIRKW